MRVCLVAGVDSRQDPEGKGEAGVGIEADGHLAGGIQLAGCLQTLGQAEGTREGDSHSRQLAGRRDGEVEETDTGGLPLRHLHPSLPLARRKIFYVENQKPGLGIDAVEGLLVLREVVVFSMGGAKCQEVLRTALAKGADKAIHVEVPEGDVTKLEPLHVARALKKIVEADKFDAVFLGKQAIDDYANQTGALLAGFLDWPQALYASKVEAEGGKLNVTREIDGGLDRVKVSLPAVISADLRLNEPRYATLPNIMKAKKKPMDKKAAKDLGIDLSSQTKILEVTEPPVRQAGGFVDDVSTLIAKLKEKGFIKA